MVRGIEFPTIESSATVAGSLADKAKECASGTKEIQTSALKVERLGYVLVDLAAQEN